MRPTGRGMPLRPQGGGGCAKDQGAQEARARADSARARKGKQRQRCNYRRLAPWHRRVRMRAAVLCAPLRSPILALGGACFVNNLLLLFGFNFNFKLTLFG